MKKIFWRYKQTYTLLSVIYGEVVNSAGVKLKKVKRGIQTYITVEIVKLTNSCHILQNLHMYHVW